MRGDFQFAQDNYPFRLDSGLCFSKPADTYLVVDQRQAAIVFETKDYAEAVREHAALRDAYYEGSVGRAALAQQKLRDDEDARNSRGREGLSGVLS